MVVISESQITLKLLNKKHVRFHPLRGLQKEFNKKWIVIEKVIYSRRNYCIIDEMALYRFFTGTAVSAKTQKHDVFLKPTVPGKKSN